MNDRDRYHLTDMLLEARRIQRFLDGLDRESFKADEVRRYAVLHALTVLGEAAYHVSDEARQASPNIRWKAIVGMRNRLIHEYFNVNLDTVWNTTQQAIPQLIEQLEAFLPPPEDA